MDWSFLGLGCCSTILILTAGCAQTAEVGGGQTLNSIAPPNGTFSPRNGSDINLPIIWTDCIGVGVRLPLPTAIYGGTNPPGWENDDPYNFVRVGLWKCERLSLGDFERGPIWTLQEWHGDDFNAPDKCNEGEYDARHILESIWFSDPELAAHVKKVYGMPAYFANFTVTTDRVDPLVRYDWNWSQPGGKSSHITYYANDVSINSTFFRLDRVYWYTGSSVNYFDLDHVHTLNQNEAPLSHGILAEPLLYGRAGPTDEFVPAASSIDRNISGTATISLFKDTRCEEPA